MKKLIAIALVLILSATSAKACNFGCGGVQGMASFQSFAVQPMVQSFAVQPLFVQSFAVQPVFGFSSFGFSGSEAFIGGGRFGGGFRNFTRVNVRVNEGRRFGERRFRDREGGFRFRNR
jgi:hypothetical protein